MIYARSRMGIEGNLVAAALLLVLAAGAAAAAFYSYQGSLPPPGSQSPTIYGGNDQSSTQAKVATVATSSSTASSSSTQATVATIATSSLSTASSSSTPSVTTSTTGLDSDNLTACLQNNPALLDQLNSTIQFIASFYGNESTGTTLSVLGKTTTATDLFDNFSQMALSYNVNASSISSSSQFSYTVVGRPVIGSLKYYEVNFTSDEEFNLASGSGANLTSDLGGPSTFTAWFAPNGTVTNATLPALYVLNQTEAAQFVSIMTASFEEELLTSAFVNTITTNSAYGILNQTTVSIGSTPVSVTYYALKSLPPPSCLGGLTAEVEGVGTLPGTNLPLVLFTQMQFTSQSVSTDISESVVSLTPAAP